MGKLLNELKFIYLRNIGIQTQNRDFLKKMKPFFFSQAVNSMHFNCE